jgi:hypothetical protein
MEAATDDRADSKLPCYYISVCMLLHGVQPHRMRACNCLKAVGKLSNSPARTLGLQNLRHVRRAERRAIALMHEPTTPSGLLPHVHADELPACTIREFRYANTRRLSLWPPLYNIILHACVCMHVSCITNIHIHKTIHADVCIQLAKYAYRAHKLNEQYA